MLSDTLRDCPAVSNHQSGQSMLEVVVASAVGILVIAALVFVTMFSLRDANFAKTSAQATKLAQEGIERVRTGRDRNQCISNLDTGVNSWNGNSSNSGCLGAGSIWSYPITGTSGNCENTTIPNSKCYFKITDSNGSLRNIGYNLSSFPPMASTENISYSNLPNQQFQRVVLLSDPTNSGTQKTVTVIVQWTDTTGTHQSQLSTILRKL